MAAVDGFSSDSKNSTLQWNQRMQNSRMVSPCVTMTRLWSDIGWPPESVGSASMYRQSDSRNVLTRS